ncbi:MAG TPA: hypothetical protein VK146_06925, partial [Tabrizicola sp.]|nr:hypothetical protein [Tabrizicola sp.]
MTTTPKVTRYNTRPVDRSALQEQDSGLPFDNHDDGFGNMDFRRPEERPAAAAAPAAAGGDTPAAEPAGIRPLPRAVTPEEIAATNAAILTEGLTERQLRRALLIAQRSHLKPTSEADAVRLLREAGVDPFSRSSILRVVTASNEAAAQN